ncbi:MAG: glycosyltransferase family 2 protein [Candidatus ainarchaeum sp.]|nr:glycosyltransferase family 2 protein [Candidatus ainarchaeum sp.]
MNKEKLSKPFRSARPLPRFQKPWEKLSIIMPVFNEERTIKILLEKVIGLELPIEKEIIIVNDGSTDKSQAIIEEIAVKNRGIIAIGKKNGGKGSAVAAGLKKATGSIMIIQDADLEYDPEEIGKVIAPILNGKANVVFGSRFKGKIIGKQIISHLIGNKVLSLATAILFFHNISDMETGYKAFRREAIKGIELHSKRFDFEPEITAKILKNGHAILEVPITYRARTHKEGKKIKISDGFVALKTLLKYRFFD